MSVTESNVNDFTCRICLEDGDRADFIAPCACAGSQRWVHRECLDKWRSVREDKAFSRCTECLKPYKMICLSQDDDTITFRRRCRFAYMIVRDFSLVLILSQTVIVVLALIVYGFDKHSHALIDTMRQENNPIRFYYLAGLFFALSILGMGFTGQHMGCCRGNGTTSSDCGTDDCICGNVYFPYIYTAPQANTLECCACHPECCACCGGDCASAGASGGGGGCAECAGGTAVGEECAMLMVVVLVVFALVGAVICVVLGVAYIQGLVRTHYHVLQKYTLATDFIVADLAEGALPITYHPGDRDAIATRSDSDGEVGADQSWRDPERHSILNGLAVGSSGLRSGGYERAPTEDNDLEQGHSIELSTYTPLPPSAPVEGVIMDRDSHMGDIEPSAPLEQDLTDFHLAYDPASHNFSQTQYNDLRRRGLI